MDLTLIREIIEISSFMLLGAIICWLLLRKSFEENKIIKKQATTDALTGKLNRFAFNRDIDTLIQRAESGNPFKFALCFMDIDGFKQINDNLGHDVGDQLLIALSDTLANNLPEYANLYRLGGDEFAIVIKNVHNKEEIEEILKKLQDAVRKPIILGENTIILEYSIGIAMYPADAKTRVDLLAAADIAMYYIKENGKNSYYFHTAALKMQVENKYQMEQSLKRAYKNKEFFVDYQPRINLKNSNEIWFESLIYWNHPTLGKLRAEYFLKYAEEMGLTIDLDEMSLKLACKKVKELTRLGYNNANIAINISIRHFKRKDFAARIAHILEEEEIPINRIALEINDRVNIKFIESYKNMMESIKQHGVIITINNYEVKYDVLKLFKKLPIDEIKISCEYLINKEEFDVDTIKNLILLSQTLGYKVTIIGVETQEQYSKVRSFGTDKIQGNFVAKIIEEEKIIAFLENIKR